MESNKLSQPILFMLAGIILGLIVGFYLGKSSSKTDLPEAVPATAEAPVETVLPVEANPYSKVKDAANPFKDSYVNPFAE